MEIEKKNIHFVGIGGAGMCGIAEVLHTMGHTISGSDIAETTVTKRLAEMGIKIFSGHDSNHVAGKNIVVYSSAINKINSELIRAREKKIPVISRGEMLAELMAFKKGIAIAGTHGKTTTTSILASIFNEANLDPTVVIGGKFSNINSNAKPGRGDFFIAEVDESDRSFLKALPTVATINNIDSDHINMFNESNASYKNFDEVIEAFSLFVRKIPYLGKIIINRDDPVLLRISREHFRDYVYFSMEDKSSTFFATNISIKEAISSFDLFFKGKFIDRMNFKMPGEHNVMNALAAISTARTLDISFKNIIEGLNNFIGIERRLEFIRDEENNKIIVDYGHHPTEIRATLKTLKEAFPEFKLIVIFQPHRYSRTETLFKDFTESFVSADTLFITEIYRASEKEIPEITGAALADKTPEASYLDNPDEILSDLRKSLKTEKSIILFLGAGDIYKTAHKLANNKLNYCF